MKIGGQGQVRKWIKYLVVVKGDPSLGTATVARVVSDEAQLQVARQSEMPTPKIRSGQSKNQMIVAVLYNPIVSGQKGCSQFCVSFSPVRTVAVAVSREQSLTFLSDSAGWRSLGDGIVLVCAYFESRSPTCPPPISLQFHSAPLDEIKSDNNDHIGKIEAPTPVKGNSFVSA